MKWIGITGSWRRSSSELEADLIREVGAELERGNGIVTGGALGVDYLATDLALHYAPDGSRIKVFLPTTLDVYAAHYRNSADKGVITPEMAERLIAQLELVNKLGSLVENPDETEVNERTYYLRNTRVVDASDEMLAFHVNASGGVQDTIDKARGQGTPVRVFAYRID